MRLEKLSGMVKSTSEEKEDKWYQKRVLILLFPADYVIITLSIVDDSVLAMNHIQAIMPVIPFL